MCTYSQLKKYIKKCVAPRGVNGVRKVPKLYASAE